MSILITFDNKLTLVNLEDFKNHPRTEGARCFKLLFRLEQDHRFDVVSMSKNQQGQLTLLEDFKISLSSWLSLVSWIRTGQVKDDQKLEEVLEISNIFGGFPVFDTYYQDCLDRRNVNQQLKYDNPLCPEDDIHQKFQWRIVDNKHCLGYKMLNEQLIKDQLTFSYTKGWTEGNDSNILTYFYIRINPKQNLDNNVSESINV